MVHYLLLLLHHHPLLFHQFHRFRPSLLLAPLCLHPLFRHRHLPAPTALSGRLTLLRYSVPLQPGITKSFVGTLKLTHHGAVSANLTKTRHLYNVYSRGAMDYALSDYITFGLRLVQLDASHSTFILLIRTKGKCEVPFAHKRPEQTNNENFTWADTGHCTHRRARTRFSCRLQHHDTSRNGSSKPRYRHVSKSVF